MPKKLLFGKKRRHDITICDYCQYYKCKWIEATPRKLPTRCHLVRKIRIADGYIPKEEFDERIKVVGKVAKYYPKEKEWRLSLDVGKNLNWKQLADIFEEINSWSGENDFSLREEHVEYGPGERPLF